MKTSRLISLGIGADYRGDLVPLLSGGFKASYATRLFAEPSFQALVFLTPNTGISPMVSVGLEGSALRMLGTGLAGLGTLILLSGILGLFGGML